MMKIAIKLRKESLLPVCHVFSIKEPLRTTESHQNVVSFQGLTVFVIKVYQWQDTQHVGHFRLWVAGMTVLES